MKILELEKIIESNNNIKSIINNINNIDNSINTNNTFNITNNQTININQLVHPIGYTDYSHINYKTAINCFKDLMTHLPDLLEEANLNEDFPRNHNVCLKNFNKKDFRIFNNKKLIETYSEDEGIKTIIHSMTNTLDDYISNLMNNNSYFNEKYSKQYEKFETDCSILEKLSENHKQSMKDNPKYRKCIKNLLAKLDTYNDMIINSMNDEDLIYNIEIYHQWIKSKILNNNIIKAIKTV